MWFLSYPMITYIQDVSPDQGGWVTLEFARSYFDGWFGNNPNWALHSGTV